MGKQYDDLVDKHGVNISALHTHQSLVGKTPAEIYWGREVAKKAA